MGGTCSPATRVRQYEGGAYHILSISFLNHALSAGFQPSLISVVVSVNAELLQQGIEPAGVFIRHVHLRLCRKNGECQDRRYARELQNTVAEIVFDWLLVHAIQPTAMRGPTQIPRPSFCPLLPRGNFLPGAHPWAIREILDYPSFGK